MLAVLFLSGAVLCGGCGGGATASPEGASARAGAPPSLSTTAALNGAVIVSLASKTAGATIYYTVDGSAPTTARRSIRRPFSSRPTSPSKPSPPNPAEPPAPLPARPSRPTFPPARWSGQMSSPTPPAAMPRPTRSVDLRHRQQRLRQPRARNLLRLGLKHRALFHNQPQRLRRHRRSSAHRRAAALARRLHLGSPQNAGPLQLSIRPLRGSRPGARSAGLLARRLAAGQQHRHRRLARLRRTGRA